MVGEVTAADAQSSWTYHVPIQEAERDGCLLLFISVQNPSPWDGAANLGGGVESLPRNFLTDMP